MQRLSADDYTWHLRAECNETGDYKRPVLAIYDRHTGNLAYLIEMGNGLTGGDFIQLSQVCADGEFRHNLNLSPDQRQRRLQAVRKALGFSYP